MWNKIAVEELGLGLMPNKFGNIGYIGWLVASEIESNKFEFELAVEKLEFGFGVEPHNFEEQIHKFGLAVSEIESNKFGLGKSIARSVVEIELNKFGLKNILELELGIDLTLNKIERLDYIALAVIVSQHIVVRLRRSDLNNFEFEG